MSEKSYNFPVWGTQGGGLVREVERGRDKYIFVEAPESCHGLTVGDYMPDEWGIIPTNELARHAG